MMYPRSNTSMLAVLGHWFFLQVAFQPASVNAFLFPSEWRASFDSLLNNINSEVLKRYPTLPNSAAAPSWSAWNTNSGGSSGKKRKTSSTLSAGTTFKLSDNFGENATTSASGGGTTRRIGGTFRVSDFLESKEGATTLNDINQGDIAAKTEEAAAAALKLADAAIHQVGEVLSQVGNTITEEAARAAERIKEEQERTLLARYTPTIPIAYRQGVPSDFGLIQKIMVQNLMNPLGIFPERFLMATDERTGEVIGFGQIKPLNNDDDSYDQKKNNRYELSSIYVMPEYRSKGVGSDIVARLMMGLESTSSTEGGSSDDVYVLTLKKTQDWYLRLGFNVVDDMTDVPTKLKMEIGAGKILTGLLGEELVCLKAK